MVKLLTEIGVRVFGADPLLDFATIVLIVASVLAVALVGVAVIASLIYGRKLLK